jgi:CRISPR-associated protein Csm2
MEKEMKKEKEIEKITKKIENFSDLSDTQLKPEDYAPPGGDAEKIAKDSRSVKTTQIRRFFNRIRALHQKTKAKKDIETVKMEILKLMPEIVWAKGRRVITDEFYNLLKACLIKDKKCRFTKYEEFDNFMSFLEAIVAYHKVYAK